MSLVNEVGQGAFQSGAFGVCAITVGPVTLGDPSEACSSRPRSSGNAVVVRRTDRADPDEIQ